MKYFIFLLIGLVIIGTCISANKTESANSTISANTTVVNLNQCGNPYLGAIQPTNPNSCISDKSKADKTCCFISLLTNSNLSTTMCYPFTTNDLIGKDLKAYINSTSSFSAFSAIDNMNCGILATTLNTINSNTCGVTALGSNQPNSTSNCTQDISNPDNKCCYINYQENTQFKSACISFETLILQSYSNTDLISALTSYIQNNGFSGNVSVAECGPLSSVYNSYSIFSILFILMVIC